MLITKEEFDSFVEVNAFEDEAFAEHWGTANGSSIVIDVADLPYFVLAFPARSTRTIVHECVHMAQAILGHKGVDITPETSEVMAYMTDFLFAEVSAILEKNG